ncbi:MAG: hypothetical protein OXC31_12630 [Spirochaetaceae bacterium]|nr:hypothetical protein [Spirochaetaceae bacterium]
MAADGATLDECVRSNFVSVTTLSNTLRRVDPQAQRAANDELEHVRRSQAPLVSGYYWRVMTRE